MAKIKVESLINVEIEKLQAKVNQFQKYLEMNPITAQVTKDSEIILSQDNQDKLHKEIIIQIKMQDALFNWLPLLEKLKKGEEGKELETRGDIEINGLFKSKKG